MTAVTMVFSKNETKKQTQTLWQLSRSLPSSASAMGLQLPPPRRFDDQNPGLFRPGTKHFQPDVYLNLTSVKLSGCCCGPHSTDGGPQKAIMGWKAVSTNTRRTPRTHPLRKKAERNRGSKCKNPLRASTALSHKSAVFGVHRLFLGIPSSNSDHKLHPRHHTSHESRQAYGGGGSSRARRHPAPAAETSIKPASPAVGKYMVS